MKDETLTADPVYQALKSAIMAGDLAPVKPLRQDEIARQHRRLTTELSAAEIRLSF